MEQHRTRHAQSAPRRRTPAPSPLPPQARRGRPGPDGGRPGRPAAGADRRADAGRDAGAAQRSAVTVRRPAPPLARPARGLPNPRLTGLGSGLFCGAVMIVLGLALRVLFGSWSATPTAYGVLFLPVCVLTTVWVRKGDLLTAPVVLPIAFAAGLVPLVDSGDGLGARLMNLVTALATEAGWLYAGTLTAGAIAVSRRFAVAHHRRRQATGRGWTGPA
ncbi:DUF6542 domain-containing protein [Streptomyces sp. NPDC049915]|uniref:DUF6542 domain-containing protein n=1 Tax=Streptomyces sp. NPDC049915 TaxID=3155510 RepID=UPI003420D6BF